MARRALEVSAQYVSRDPSLAQAITPATLRMTVFEGEAPPCRGQWTVDCGQNRNYFVN